MDAIVGSMSTPKKPCGPHIELSSSKAARVMRCPCGTIHIHLAAQGITLRVNGEDLRHLGNALSAASRLIDVVEAPSAGGESTVN